MEQINELITQLEDSFISSGEASNREEARKLVIELIMKQTNNN